MSDKSGSRSRNVTVSIAAAVLLCVVLIALGAGGIQATHEEERTTNGFKAYTPSGNEIPHPGRTYDVELYMAPAHAHHDGPIPPKAEFRVDYIMYYSPTISRCDVEDVRVGGVDRGNNDSGTHTDKELVENLYGNGDYNTTPASDPGPVANTDWDHRQVTWLQFPPEDSLYEQLNMHTNGVQDEGILAVEDCIEAPHEPGWYRTWVFVNGTLEKIHGEDDQVTVQGETYEPGDYFEGWEPSPWYPVCTCNRTWHVPMKLDVPPGKSIRSPRGSVIYPNGSAEIPSVVVQEDGTMVYDGPEGRFTMPPENVTSEGVHFPDGVVELKGGTVWFSEGRIEPDGTIVTPGGKRYPPGDQQSGGTPTPTTDPTTATSSGPSTVTPTPPEGAAATVSNTASGTTTPTKEGTEREPTTPSAADGPGFGPLLALAALLAAVAVRRRER